MASCDSIYLCTLCMVIFCFSFINSQTPCCSPNQWFGHLLQNTGEYNSQTDTASKSDVSTMVYYDYTGKRLATVTDLYNQTYDDKTMVRRIMDYSKGMEWRIIGNSVCTRHQLTEVMPSPCFLEGAASFGSHQIIDLPVDVWYKELSGGGNIRATMSRDQCLFVLETSLSSGPDYVLSFGIYENITGGSVPSSAFDVPAMCPRSGPIYLDKSASTQNLPWHLPTDILLGRY